MVNSNVYIQDQRGGPPLLPVVSSIEDDRAAADQQHRTGAAEIMAMLGREGIRHANDTGDNEPAVKGGDLVSSKAPLSLIEPPRCSAQPAGTPDSSDRASLPAAPSRVEEAGGPPVRVRLETEPHPPRAGSVSPHAIECAGLARPRSATWCGPGCAPSLPLDMPLRRGRWTTEEESYAVCLIQHFERGLLNISPGTSLRNYLAEKLHCDPMRITKKFAGDSSVGKRVYHPCQRTLDTASEMVRAINELSQHERCFSGRIKARQPKRGSGAGSAGAASAEAQARVFHSSHSAPHVDANFGPPNPRSHVRPAAAGGVGPWARHVAQCLALPEGGQHSNDAHAAAAAGCFELGGESGGGVGRAMPHPHTAHFPAAELPSGGGASQPRPRDSPEPGADEGSRKRARGSFEGLHADNNNDFQNGAREGSSENGAVDIGAGLLLNFIQGAADAARQSSPPKRHDSGHSSAALDKRPLAKPSSQDASAISASIVG